MATKEKNSSKNSSGMDQNAIRRAAKARRKNSPKKNTTPGFSLAEAKQEKRESLKRQREIAREVAMMIREKKQLGLAINECINAVFAGADRTGLCLLYSDEKPQYMMNEDGTDYKRNDYGDLIQLDPKYSHKVRCKAAEEIIAWCEKNAGKYECRINYGVGVNASTFELALANLMHVKKG